LPLDTAEDRSKLALTGAQLARDPSGFASEFLDQGSIASSRVNQDRTFTAVILCKRLGGGMSGEVATR
jgi:hypothetical protein